MALAVHPKSPLLQPFRVWRKGADFSEQASRSYLSRGNEPHRPFTPLRAVFVRFRHILSINGLGSGLDAVAQVTDKVYQEKAVLL